MRHAPDKDVRTYSIKARVMRACTVFTLILTVALVALGAISYRYGIMTRYETFIQDLLNYTITEIDADALGRDIQRGTTSAEYQAMQDMLDETKEKFSVHYIYIYIVKPLSTEPTDNMMNVMASATTYEKEHEADTLVHLGDLTGDAYAPDVASYYLDAMETSKGAISYFSSTTKYGSDFTGVTPIVDSSGKAVAILAVDISTSEINDSLMRYVVLSFFNALILVVFFTIFMHRWFDKNFVNPITAIRRAATSFVASSHGKSNPEEIEYVGPQLTYHDEVWELSESLDTMATDLKTYMGNLLQETQEKERISTELNVATQIQADMLPSIFPPFPEHREIDIYATMDPAKEVGGDFYDLFEVDDKHVTMVIADVSGKSVPAALFMVIAKTLIKNRAQMGGGPAEILNDVNLSLCEGNGTGMFVTAWLAILDITTGKGVVANAGHEHPALCRAGGSWELVKYRHSPALAMGDFVKYREHEFELQPGDRVFVYTDGVPEATNKDDELYGEERMLDALNSTEPDAGLIALLHSVRKSVAEFVGDVEQFDDLTMLAIQYKGPQSET